jgi:hypothetical protein
MAIGPVLAKPCRSTPGHSDAGSIADSEVRESRKTRGGLTVWSLSRPQGSTTNVFEIWLYGGFSMAERPFRLATAYDDLSR